MQRVAAAAITLLCAAPVAGAAAAEGVDGERRREGFYFRMDFGIGAIGMGDVQLPVSRDLSPMAFSLGVVLGAAVSQRVVLGVELAGIGADDTPAFGAEQGKNRFVLGFVGPHASFYVLPGDGYVSLAVGLGVVQTMKDGGDLNWTSGGFAGRFGIGKEVRAAPKLAVGICGQLWFGAGRDWSAPAVGLALSLTYN